eukprot:TRINITY_DN3328_c0_g1_i1.p1 TRINITY_DN3328_c0_g1~~TRINITY_DN3328_c0_g1_i1.p1  ORF type:complete len:172 (+),score=23.13 TRINITY_DN3328_c0_g1_i1:3-518(+)
MEMAGSDSGSRAEFAPRLQEHHSTLARLRADLQRAQEDGGNSILSQQRQSLFSSGSSLAGDTDLESGQQMERLLSTQAKQRETSARLEETLRICGESEQVGAGVLESLHSQRGTIMNSLDKVNSADEDLARSGKTLRLLERGQMWDNILRTFAKCLLVVLIVFILYYVATR